MHEWLGNKNIPYVYDYEFIWTDVNSCEYIQISVNSNELLWRWLYELIWTILNRQEFIWMIMSGCGFTINDCDVVWIHMNDFEQVWIHN